MPKSLLPHHIHHSSTPVPARIDALRGSNPQSALALHAPFHELDLAYLRPQRTSFCSLFWEPAQQWPQLRQRVYVCTLEALWPQQFISLSRPSYLAKRSFPWGSGIESVRLGLYVIKRCGWEELESQEEMVHLFAFWWKRNGKNKQTIHWLKADSGVVFCSQLLRTEHEPQERWAPDIFHKGVGGGIAFSLESKNSPWSQRTVISPSL